MELENQQQKDTSKPALGAQEKKASKKPTKSVKDGRPEAIAQRKLQDMANNSPQAMRSSSFHDMANNKPLGEQTAQLNAKEKPKKNAGLPDDLKTGMENLSGISLDDVKVHRNSDKPSQLQAHAYAQGTDIHLGPGQEKHLPHELAHVVQQKQGRVKPTIQTKTGVNVNDDPKLEKEADQLAQKANHLQTADQTSTQPETKTSVSQLKLVQRQLGEDEQVDQLQSSEILCSMSPDGKIGSVYFEDSRIRTTHADGPAWEFHDEGWTRLQFNIDENIASSIFTAENPGKDPAKNFNDYTSFLVQNLINCSEGNTPPWAKFVSSVADAPDASQAAMDDNQKLFEIFKTAKGKSAATHLSRGGAVKLAVDSNITQVLKDAISHVIHMQFDTYEEDNEAFYNYIKEHAPDFAEKLRKHNEIDYDG